MFWEGAHEFHGFIASRYNIQIKGNEESMKNHWLMDKIVLNKTFVRFFVVWYVICVTSVYTLLSHTIPTNSPQIIYLICQPVCYALLLASFMYLLGKWRILFLPFFMYVYIVELTEHWLFAKFRTYFTGDLLLMAMNSSWDEIRVFVSDSFSWSLFFILLVVVIAGYFIIRVLFAGKIGTGLRTRLLIFGVCLVPFVAFNCLLLNPRNIPSQMMFVLVVTDTIRSLRINSEIYAACKRPGPIGDVHLSSVASGDPVGVVMVGESMTRNNLGIYGYARNTTPEMKGVKNGELFVFTDLLGVWSNTQGALRHLLTEFEIGGETAECALPYVCRRAGYECVLLSNQNHWGAYDTIDTLLFSACKDATWIGELKADHKLYDIDMVPMLKDKLTACSSQPFICFMHLAGSHNPFTYYPKEFTIFKPDFVDKCNAHLTGSKRVQYNDYDNTILHTDATFGGVVRVLGETHRPAFVLLVSDHGETPRVGKWRVGTHKDLWEIPMVVWVSEEYEKAYPATVKKLRGAVGRKLQQDQLFVGMLSLAQIVGFSRYSEERDFLSSKFKVREMRMVQNGKVPYEGDK